jgi:hypothetical protein
MPRSPGSLLELAGACWSLLELAGALIYSRSELPHPEDFPCRLRRPQWELAPGDVQEMEMRPVRRTASEASGLGVAFDVVCSLLIDV